MRPLRLVSSLLPPLPRHCPRARTPSTSSPPAPCSPTPPPLMCRQGRRQHIGDRLRWSSARAQQKPTPNPIRSIDKTMATDCIEGARMASPPLLPGFASRRVESPWPPPRVTSIAATSQIHRRGQESRPGKEDKAVVMQIMMFLAGINTLLQSFFGTQLPAVIGGSYTFVLPTILIILVGCYTNEPDLHTT